MQKSYHLSRGLILILIFHALTVQLMGISAQGSSEEYTKFNYGSIIDEMGSDTVTLLSEINKVRLRQGISPLAPNAILNTIAQTHLGELQNRGEVYGDVHTRRDGTTVNEWLRSGGYPSYSSDNPNYQPDVIAVVTGQQSDLLPKNIIEYWGNNPRALISLRMSQTGSANPPIFSTRYREVGLAYAKNLSNGRSLFVMIFASQPNAMPVIVAQSASPDPAKAAEELHLIRDAVTRRDVVLFISNELAYPNGDGNAIGQAVFMRITEQNDIRSCPISAANLQGWIPYAAEYPFLLSESLDIKQIHVYFCDAIGRQVETEVSVLFTGNPNQTVYIQWTGVPTPIIRASELQQTAAAIATQSAATLPVPIQEIQKTADLTVNTLQATLDYLETLATPTAVIIPENLNKLGNAHIYPFYDDTVNFQDITIVQLQLILYELEVTPTPFGEVTFIPANTDLERPEVKQAQNNQTLRPAELEGNIQGLPPHVVAELECNESFFSGCGPQSVRNIQLQGANKWFWQIQPLKKQSSRQALSLVLYSADEDGIKQSTTPLWNHPFEITIEAPSEFLVTLEQSTGVIIGGFAIIGCVIIIGALISNRKRDNIKVFISYNRKTSAGFAQILHDKLEALGAEVFIDVDDIHAGPFSDYIEQNIVNSCYLIVLLASGTLKSEWVIKEIKYAYEHKKIIIPILLNDFDLYGSEITDDIKFIQSFHAIELYPQFIDAVIGKIAIYIGLLK